MSKLPIFELVISVGNLKPKLKWFFKPKLKVNFFPLNCHPGLPSGADHAAPGAAEDGARQQEPAAAAQGLRDLRRRLQRPLQGRGSKVSL